MAESTGLLLSQIFLEIESGTAIYTYSPEQEKMFVTHPKVLALFDLLMSGDEAESIRRRFSLKTEDRFSMLSKLDRMGLIELHEKNRIKLKKTDKPQ